MRVSKNWVKFNKMFTLSPWGDILSFSNAFTPELLILIFIEVASYSAMRYSKSSQMNKGFMSIS